MTNRENFLSLLRRQGYERVPVEFVLCPHLQEVCRKELGAEDYEEYFGMPWRRVDDLRLKDQDVEKFRNFMIRNRWQKEQTSISGVWDMKNRPTACI